jgi:hypothetical protein
LKRSHAFRDSDTESAESRQMSKKKHGKGEASEEADKHSTFSILLDLVDH